MLTVIPSTHGTVGMFSSTCSTSRLHHIKTEWLEFWLLRRVVFCVCSDVLYWVLF